MKPWSWRFLLQSREDEPVRPRLFFTVTLLVGLLLTFSTAYLLHEQRANYIQQEIRAQSSEAANKIQSRMKLYVYGLLGLRGAFLAHPGGMDYEAFHRYAASRNIHSEFPGMQGYGYIKRLPRSLSDEQVKADALSMGITMMKLKQFNAVNRERWVIYLLTPETPNKPAIGLDIASEDRRHRALVQAASTGEATLTEPIHLVQVDKSRKGFLLVLPVYASIKTPESLSERANKVIGLVNATLIADMVLGGSIPTSMGLNAAAYSQAGTLVPFFQSPAFADPGSDLVSHQIDVSLLGQRWQLTFTASPSTLVSQQMLKPWHVILIGSLLSLLLAALFHSYALFRHQQVTEWTSKARLWRMLRNTNDAIVEIDSGNRITDWNQAGTNLFGYSTDMVMGQNFLDLLTNETSRQSVLELLNNVLSGSSVQHTRCELTRVDGATLHVDFSAFKSEGTPASVQKRVLLIHDVSREHQAELQIRQLNSTLEQEVARRTEELQIAKRDLETIFDAMPSMIGYWDKNLINRVANKAYQVWFATDHGEIHGHHMSELLGRELYQQNLPHIRRVLAGEAQQFERSITSRDGTVRHSLAHYLPDRIAGEVVGFYVIVHDVTEITESRMRLEALVQQNTILLTTINQQMLYSVTDAKGRIIEINDNFTNISGYSQEELIGSNHRLISSNTHSREFWQEIWKTIRSGKAWSGEVCNRKKSGELYWVDSVIAPFYGSNGEIERYVSLRIDITQRKKAELELQRITALFREVLAAASGFSIIATDADGIITVFNRGAEEMLGYSAEEMVGKQTPALIHCPQEVVARGIELSRLSGSNVSGFRVFVHLPEQHGVERSNWHYVRKDGRRVPVSLSVTVLRAPNGCITGYLGIAQDISERIHFEEALLESKNIAEEASQAKSNFLATMSHEIRTPMNGIIGLCYMLEKQALHATPLDMVRKIKIASHHLLSIINDILDFSKIEAGHLQLERVAFDLQETMDNLSSIAQGALGNKPVTVNVNQVPDEARYLIGDPLRLSQVLTNLLGNAVKFTNAGSVCLDANVVSRGSTTISLHFAIRDTGIGIPKDKLELIFDAFSQADSSISRNHGGTGLGLAISKRLVELMGGVLTVHSVPGQGSEFSFVIDFQLDAERKAESRKRFADDPVLQEPQALAGLRLLLVDDSSLNREVATFILERAGALVVQASDGQEAVNTLKQAPALFDLVLMDVQMPVMDGYTATRCIRDNAATRHLPVLALTAGAFETQRDQALAAGMNGFIAKPFEATMLISTIKEHVTQPAIADSVDSAADDPELEQMMAMLRGSFVHDSLPRHLETLRGSRPDVASERADLAKKLHKLAGEAGTVGLLPLSRQARALEQRLLQSDQPTDGEQEALAELLHNGEILLAEAH
ncbi:CHASE domain-containing hybrid sensor histidine kinase/response regulator [Perlucidibaca piscinae]|uniref:CHASE domain-containing hybrid sensor histidine kinase/response regulator n=1 Tax=Perlucidibaca piscinae TaxID=392589 RepID=UPI0003F5EB1C|nr:PAS domain S-box protein [Perlucidibaca piscinae]